MARRTKFSKFRSLYDVIENLLDTYTHEGVVEILAESHDLELSVSTLRSYLYRHKNQSKELSVATDSSNGKVEIKHEADADASAKPHVDPTIDEFEAAIEEAKRRISNKSILNRR